MATPLTVLRKIVRDDDYELYVWNTANESETRIILPMETYVNFDADQLVYMEDIMAARGEWRPRRA